MRQRLVHPRRCAAGVARVGRCTGLPPIIGQEAAVQPWCEEEQPQLQVERAIRDVEKINCPSLLGLDCQIQAMRRRIWLSGGSDWDDYFLPTPLVRASASAVRTTTFSSPNAAIARSLPQGVGWYQPWGMRVGEGDMTDLGYDLTMDLPRPGMEALAGFLTFAGTRETG